MVITTFQFISELKATGLWNGCLCLFSRAATLDLYYRIYQSILLYEPDRSYGYRLRLCRNQEVTRRIGGEHYVMDEITIGWAIKEMERPLFFSSK